MWSVQTGTAWLCGAKTRRSVPSATFPVCVASSTFCSKLPFPRLCRHLDGIESSRIESNRIESNQIKSNRIESNRIESNRIESNRIFCSNTLTVINSPIGIPGCIWWELDLGSVWARGPQQLDIFSLVPVPPFA